MSRSKKLKDDFADKKVETKEGITLEISSELMPQFKAAAARLGLTPEEAMSTAIDLFLRVSEKYKPGDSICIVDPHDLVKAVCQLDIAPDDTPPQAVSNPSRNGLN